MESALAIGSSGSDTAPPPHYFTVAPLDTTAAVHSRLAVVMTASPPGDQAHQAVAPLPLPDAERPVLEAFLQRLNPGARVIPTTHSQVRSAHTTCVARQGAALAARRSRRLACS